MKTLSHLALILVFIASIPSCKKSGTTPTDNNSNGTTAPKKKYLKQVIQVRNGTTAFTNYTYDSQKRIATVTTGTTVTTYTYNGNDLITTDLTFLSGTDVIDVIAQYTYVNGTLTQVVPYTTTNGVKKDGNSSTFVFVNGRITERHVDTGDVMLYTYADNGDLLKTQASGITTTYTYSDKKNLVAPTTFVGPADYVSPHLILSLTQSIALGTISYSYTFDANGNVSQMNTEAKNATYLNAITKYAYDSDGYMSALSYEAPNMTTTNYKITFVYTEL